MAYSNILQGARAAFKITTPDGEKVVAWATGVSVSENREHVPAYVIDSIGPKEIVPVAYSCSMSCTTFLVPGQSPVSLGIAPRVQDILTAPDLKCVIYDRNGDVPIRVMEQVRFVGRNAGVAARGEGTETWDFVGIIMYDEAGNGSV